MTRSRTIAMLLAITVIATVIVIEFCRGTKPSAGANPSVSLPVAAQTAITNSVESVKNRITGGIGVAVAMNSTMNLPQVGAVAVNSPASEAGLRFGDVITRVGGITTTGLVLKQVVDNLRGFTGASVPVTVLRGTNYLDFVIRRTSMKNLREKKFNAGE